MPYHWDINRAKVKDTEAPKGRAWTYEISIDKTKGYGCFEHSIYGEDEGGTLTFENGVLVDFDGVSALPDCVAEFLRSKGYTVDQDMVG
jgi:hypothetical protein